MLNQSEFSTIYKGQRYLGLKFEGDENKTPVILLHGLLCSIYFWYPEHFSVFGDRPVYSIALPGHFPASSIEKKTSFTIDSLVSHTMAQVNEAVGMSGEFILVGHSTGAMIGGVIAARYPERVKGFVSIGGTHYGQEDAGLYGVFQWLAVNMGSVGLQIINWSLKVNSLSLVIHKLFFGDVAYKAESLLKHPRIDDYLSYYFPALRALDGISPGLLLRDLKGIDISSELKNVRCPSLVLCGNKDPYVSQERTMAMHHLVSKSELEWISNSGHLPMFENWQEYERAMIVFFSRLSEEM